MQTREFKEKEDLSTELGEQALVSSRTSTWFAAFVEATTEKQETASVLKRLISIFVSKLKETNIRDIPCSVMDIGVGEGTLAKEIALTLQNHCLRVDYKGIDIDSNFVKQTQAKLDFVKIEKHSIIHGNCFGNDLGQLPNNPSLVIVSHVAYYTGDVKKFITSLIKKINHNTILIFIHAPTVSEHMKLRTKYGAKISTDIPKLIQEAIKEEQKPILSLWNFLFTSFIEFPINSEAISRIANAAYESLKDKHKEFKARNLLEFVIQRKTEELRKELTLHDYVQHMTKTLFDEVNKLHIWTNMQIVIPRDSVFFAVVRATMRDFMHYRDECGISPIHWAAYQGNLEVVETFVSTFEESVVNCKNLGILTPLWMAIFGIMSRKNCYKVVDFLLTYDIDAESAYACLSFSIFLKESILTTQLQKYVNSKEYNDSKDLVFYDAEDLLISTPHNNKAPFLEDKLITSINQVYWIQENIPELLKKHYYSKKLTQCVIVNHDIEILSYLKEKNSNLLFHLFERDRKNIAHLSANVWLNIDEKKNVETLKWIRNNFPAMIYEKSVYDGKTIIHRCLDHIVKIKVLKWLWNNYRELFDEPDNDGHNPLVTFVNSDSTESYNKICLLLDWIKVHIPYWFDYKDSTGNNILQFAITKKSGINQKFRFLSSWFLEQEEYKSLLKEVNIYGANIAHTAAQWQNIDALNFISENSNLRYLLLEKDNLSKNILHYCAQGPTLEDNYIEIHFKDVTFSILNIIKWFQQECSQSFVELLFGRDVHGNTVIHHYLKKKYWILRDDFLIFLHDKRYFELLLSTDQQGNNIAHIAIVTYNKINSAPLIWIKKTIPTLLEAENVNFHNPLQYCMTNQKSNALALLDVLDWVKLYAPNLFSCVDINYRNPLFFSILSSCCDKSTLEWFKENLPNQLEYFDKYKCNIVHMLSFDKCYLKAELLSWIEYHYPHLLKSKNIYGYLPIDIAYTRNNVDVLRWFGEKDLLKFSEIIPENIKKSLIKGEKGACILDAEILEETDNKLQSEFILILQSFPIEYEKSKKELDVRYDTREDMLCLYHRISMLLYENKFTSSKYFAYFAKDVILKDLSNTIKSTDHKVLCIRFYHIALKALHNKSPLIGLGENTIQERKDFTFSKFKIHSDIALEYYKVGDLIQSIQYLKSALLEAKNLNSFQDIIDIGTELFNIYFNIAIENKSVEKVSFKESFLHLKNALANSIYDTNNSFLYLSLAEKLIYCKIYDRGLKYLLISIKKLNSYAFEDQLYIYWTRHFKSLMPKFLYRALEINAEQSASLPVKFYAYYLLLNNYQDFIKVFPRIQQKSVCIRQIRDNFKMTYEGDFLASLMLEETKPFLPKKLQIAEEIKRTEIFMINKDSQTFIIEKMRAKEVLYLDLNGQRPITHITDFTQRYTSEQLITYSSSSVCIRLPLQWLDSLLKIWIYRNDILELKSLIHQYKITDQKSNIMHWQKLLSDDIFFRQARLKLHPDKHVLANKEKAKQDFQFIQNFREEFNADNTENLVHQAKISMYKLSVSINVADTVLNIARAYNEPTLYNVKVVIIGGVYAANLYHRLSHTLIFTNTLLISYTCYEHGIDAAANQMFIFSAFMLAPRALAYTANPYFGLFYISGVTMYSAYHLIQNTYSLYQEISSEDNELKSITAYKNFYQWLSGYAAVKWFEVKIEKYEVKIHILNLSREHSFLNKECNKKHNDAICSKVEKYIYHPYFEKRSNLLEKIAEDSGRIRDYEKSFQEESFLKIDNLKYEICYKGDQVAAKYNYYYCWNEALEKIAKLTIGDGILLDTELL